MCAKELKDEINIVRMYNNVGQHVVSLLPCETKHGIVLSWDLCKPDGTVKYCGIKNDLMDSFAELLGWEELY